MSTADVEDIRRLPEYQALKKKLGDREWRLDNLYFIRDEEGDKLKFVRNEAQRAFFGEMTLRNLLPKARKLGFSTFIGILICDTCVFRSGTVAGIVDRTLDDATDKLAIIRYAYENMPRAIREENPLVANTTEFLKWRNGSSVSVGTSYRGGTPSLLHISEYGKISVDKPDVAREIRNGAIKAVPATGCIWIESTAHGTQGEFRDYVHRAQAHVGPKTVLDYNLQFFGWWIKKEYRLPHNLVVVQASTKKYLDEVEKKIGRRIDANQRAWYQKTLEELGPDDIKEEFPSTVDELFFVSLEGAFWREEIGRARRDERIGLKVPFDPSRPVNTFWDIGEDTTAIWFHQTDGVRHRLIDYYEEEGGSLQKCAGVLEDKRRDRGFVYSKHYGPHDLDQRVWSQDAKTRKATAIGFGIEFTVVDRIEVKADSIEAGRRMINMSWFDDEHCRLGVSRLENYSKKWNKAMGQWDSDPKHDINSHAADSWQQGAMGLQPERVSRGDRRGRDRKGSAWAR